MASIPGLAITKPQLQYVQTPLEVDLLAFFMVAKDDILEMLAQAQEEGWDAEAFMAEVDMLLDGTGERVEFQRMIQKARGFPDYTMRQRKDGYWHIKIPGKGWVLTGGPEAQYVKDVLAAAGLKRPPHMIPYDPNKPGGEGESLHPSQEPAKLKREAYLQWRRDNPDEFLSAIAHAVEAKVGGHPLFNKDDIKAKLNHGTLDEEDLAEIAEQYDVQIPDKWEDLDRHEKMKKDRKRFVEELLEARRKHYKQPDVPANVRRRYEQMDDAQLLDRARMYIPKGPKTVKAEAEAQKKKDEAQKVVIARQKELRDEWEKHRDAMKDLSYEEQAKKHPDLFIKKIVGAEDFDNIQELEDAQTKYRKMNATALVRRAEMHLGHDKVHELHQMIKKQAQYKMILTTRSRMHNEAAEARLVDHEEGNEPRVILGDANMNNVNVTMKVWLKDPSGNEVPAVWKSLAREHKTIIRAGIPAGEQWIRERGAYEVNAIVGLNNNPVVALRELPGEGVGAIMDFVPGKPWYEANAHYDDFPVIEWKKLALHGYLVGTEDMHGKNFMADVANKKLYCIDNGLTLPEHKEWYRNTAHDQLRSHGDDRALPDELADLVTEEKRDKAEKAMRHLGLGEPAIEAMKNRFDYIIKNRKLPVTA